MQEIKNGDRVRLSEFWDEGELIDPEQNATILGLEANGVIMVKIDAEFRTDHTDDGLREITLDQIKAVL